MSQYDDDEPEYEEPTPEPPVDTTPAGTFTATVAREEIARMVADRFFSHMRHYAGDEMNKTVARALRRMIGEKAAAEIDRLTGDAVLAETGDMIANGWPTTDQYGAKSGTVTVRDLVVRYLTKPANDYGDRQPRMNAIIDKLFVEAVKAEIGPLLEDVKKQLKTLLDKNVGEAIRVALLQGAGLRERG